MKNKDIFLYTPEMPLSLVSFEKFFLAVEKKKQLFKFYHTILLQTQNLLTFYSSIIAAKELDISLYLCPITFDNQKMLDLAKKWNAVIYFGNNEIETPFELNEKKVPYLGIFTSATTGEPKMALLRWGAIEYSSKFVPPELHQQTWLLSYAPWSYAGLQVFFAAWHSGGSIYHRNKSFKEIGEEVVGYGITIISATPTFWKLLISAWPSGLEPLHLLQATVGGEIVDQAAINLIDNFFQPRHLTHIYASTEAGTAIVVSDRMAGFPVALLQKQAQNGLKLRIVDHELQIWSPVGMDRYIEGNSPKVDENWLQTGDLVEVKNNRVYFLGRKDGRINIGGRKVCPEEIEQALNSLEEIEDSLVYEKKSPLVGSIVAADVLIKNPEHFKPGDIKKRLQNLLEGYKIPQIIRRVEYFATSNAGKKIRQ